MTHHATSALSPGRAGKSRLARIVENRDLYLFCLPGIIITLIFHYWPLYGAQIAFRDYSARAGIWGSPWVGWEHFIRFFNSPNAGLIIWNTLVLSVYGLVAGFPIPIILALLLNSFRHKKYGKVIQSVTYAPNFISTVVMCSMIILFLSPRVGLVNKLLEMAGLPTVNFMGERSLWRHIYVWSGIWQTAGYSSIIYIAALAGVSKELQEAAIVDGASRAQRIWHVDLSAIRPTIVILLIFNCGSIMSIGFEKVYLMQNAINISTSEVISTFVYKVGLQNANYSFSTAVGLFNSIISFVLMMIVNQLSKKLTDTSVW